MKRLLLQKGTAAAKNGREIIDPHLTRGGGSFHAFYPVENKVIFADTHTYHKTDKRPCYFTEICLLRGKEKDI